MALADVALADSGSGGQAEGERGFSGHIYVEKGSIDPPQYTSTSVSFLGDHETNFSTSFGFKYLTFFLMHHDSSFT